VRSHLSFRARQETQARGSVPWACTAAAAASGWASVDDIFGGMLIDGEAAGDVQEGSAVRYLGIAHVRDETRQKSHSEPRSI
jgi:hypothetical protein